MMTERQTNTHTHTPSGCIKNVTYFFKGIKGGLIRDLIGYSMHEKQDNNVKELIKYLCTE